MARKININDNSVQSGSQKDRILDYLMEGHSLTPLEALNLFGCFRLGARTERVQDPRTGKYYASYSLV